MSTHIQTLKEAILPVRNRLIDHPVYRSVHSTSDLRIFMEHHVYAVWDFMSLLKGLQRGLTCVTIPWVPVGSANTRYLINEIVTGEESDVDDQGRRMSHFELYLLAMHQAGADDRPVRDLVKAVSEGMPIKQAIAKNVRGRPLRQFMAFTFDTIATGELPALAAVFTFGREDLIPDMFLRIVHDLAKEERQHDAEGDNRQAAETGTFGLFRYYLERHIEVDGGHHGQLALAMVEELCGDDPVKWEQATRYAIAALESRILLWDGVLAAIRDRMPVAGQSSIVI